MRNGWRLVTYVKRFLLVLLLVPSLALGADYTRPDRDERLHNVPWNTPLCTDLRDAIDSFKYLERNGRPQTDEEQIEFGFLKGCQLAGRTVFGKFYPAGIYYYKGVKRYIYKVVFSNNSEWYGVFNLPIAGGFDAKT